jgi:hypothetical protein
MLSYIDADEIPTPEILRLLDEGHSVKLCGCSCHPMEMEGLAEGTNAYGQPLIANNTLELVEGIRKVQGRCGLEPDEPA